jgi:6-phospho-beta-glucosidase
LPEDASIEVNAIIDREGAHPIRVETQPTPPIRGLLQLVKAYEELTIRAAIEGDHRAALQALTLHPLVTSGHTAEQMLHDILEENRSFLPRFFE